MVLHATLIWYYRTCSVQYRLSLCSVPALHSVPCIWGTYKRMCIGTGILARDGRGMRFVFWEKDMLCMVNPVFLSVAMTCKAWATHTGGMKHGRSGNKSSSQHVDFHVLCKWNPLNFSTRKTMKTPCLTLFRWNMRLFPTQCLPCAHEIHSSSQPGESHILPHPCGITAPPGLAPTILDCYGHCMRFKC